MTTKEQILEQIQKKKDESKGLIRSMYDDCAELVTNVHDNEQDLTRTIADQQEKIREMEEFLEPGTHYTQIEKTKVPVLASLSAYPDMCAVHRALGSIEGVCDMLEDPAASALLGAVEMIDAELSKAEHPEWYANGQ